MTWSGHASDPGQALPVILGGRTQTAARSRLPHDLVGSESGGHAVPLPPERFKLQVESQRQLMIPSRKFEQQRPPMN